MTWLDDIGVLFTSICVHIFREMLSFNYDFYHVSMFSPICYLLLSILFTAKSHIFFVSMLSPKPSSSQLMLLLLLLTTHSLDLSVEHCHPHDMPISYETFFFLHNFDKWLPNSSLSIFYALYMTRVVAFECVCCCLCVCHLGIFIAFFVLVVHSQYSRVICNITLAVLNASQNTRKNQQHQQLNTNIGSLMDDKIAAAAARRINCIPICYYVMPFNIQPINL